jgi:diacylglycerol kinase
MKAKTFSFRARAKSFRFAWEGIARFFACEHNAWIHLAFTILVFMASWYLHVSRSEFLLLIIATGFVWVAEIFNTAIEKIMDFIEPGYHMSVKRIKDLSAAAVLVAAITAATTGAFIFIPKLS